jgi:two-component system response regulator QseB
MRLLLVEDDVLLGRSMVESLRREGYTVDWLEKGSGVVTSLTTELFSAVILDLMLPDTDGFRVLKAIRSAGHSLPVLILTARDEIDDRVRGLDIGADDYLVKPFALQELLARIRVLIRRQAGATESTIVIDNLVLNLGRHQIDFYGDALKLTNNEYKILASLITHAGRVLSKEQLAQALHGWEEIGSDNAIEVHIHNLRKKVPGNIIKNIRGVGYIIEK